jgi:hypothetical protein
MEEIKQWLDDPSRDYFQGVKLYERHGDDVRLKLRVFPMGPFLGNQRQLHYELEKIYNSRGGTVAAAPKPEKVKKQKAEPTQEPTAGPDQKPEPVKVPVPQVETMEGYLKKEFPKINYETLPDPLKVLVVDRIALFNKAKHAREQMFAADSDDERGKWSRIQSESMIANKLIWKELHHYNQTGNILGEHPNFARMKELEKFQSMTREQLFKKKKNFASFISKANKAIREANGDEDIIARQQVLLEKYAWQEKEVDRLLGL